MDTLTFSATQAHLFITNTKQTTQTWQHKLILQNLFSLIQGQFIWTPKQQSQLFASIMWGGMLTCWFAGWFSDKYGGKRVLLWSTVGETIGWDLQ